MTKAPLIILGSAFTALVLLSAAFQVVFFGVPWLGDRATEHITYTEAISKLVVEADNSDFQVRGSDREGVKVTRKLKWHSDRPRSEESVDGQGVLTITPVDCEGRGLCDIDYVIDVPADLDVEIVASSGDIETSGLAGSQTLHADSGDIEVRNSSGTLRLDASSGDVDVRAAEPSDVDVHTSSGDIGIDLPRGDYDASATADSGNVNVDVQLDNDSEFEIRADASSGDIDISYR